jgi:hypothetical protein
MPIFAPELQLGVLRHVQKALGRVTVRPQDAEPDMLTALFFLRMDDYPLFKKEEFRIGRDNYSKDSKAIGDDSEAVVDYVREYLIAASKVPAKTPSSLADQLISNLKKVGNPTTTPTTNTPASSNAWALFTDTIIGSAPPIDILSRAIKDAIAAKEHALLTDVLKRQTARQNEDAEKDDLAFGRTQNLQDAEARKKELGQLTAGKNVRNLIDKFEHLNKPPALPRAPRAAAKKPKDNKDDEDAALKRRKAEEEARKRREAEEARKRKEAEEARKRKEDEEARKRKEEEEARKRKEEEEARKRKEEEEARKRKEEEEARKRQETEDAERKRQEDEAAKKPADETPAPLTKIKNPITMHQQTMSQTVMPVPVVTITSVTQLDHILAAAKALSDKKQLKDINQLFAQFHQQSLIATDPVTRNLELRQKLLAEWNNNLLPLQSELLDRIASLEVLRNTLDEAKNFTAIGVDNGESIKAQKAYLEEIGKRMIAVDNALDSYHSTLDECNKIETGLANTNVTVYHDPDYEGKTDVAASVVKKISANEDRGAILDSMRADLGKKIDARNSNSIAFGLSTQAFDYEHAKIDTTRDYTLLGFIGSDSKQVNSVHGDISSVRMQSNLNTIYSLSANENNRKDFTLQVVELREDLDPTHLMAKFVTDLHEKFGDLLPLFGDSSADDLYKLFSQLPKKIPDIKTLENFLAHNMQPDANASPARVAKAMHKELMRTLRNEKYPDVPSNDALRLAKEAVNQFIDLTGGGQLIIIHGQNAEMRRAMKYYCQMMFEQFKGYPDKQRSYEYFDDQDKFRPVLQAGLWSTVKSALIRHDPAEKPVLGGLNKEGRRVAKEIVREDEVEFDKQVKAKTSFTEEIAAQKNRATNLAVLTNTLQSTNNLVGSSGILEEAVTAARANARSAQRLPQATTSLSRGP